MLSQFRKGQVRTCQVRIAPKLSQHFEGPWRLTSVRKNKLTATCLETGRTPEIHPDTARPALEEYVRARATPRVYIKQAA